MAQYVSAAGPLDRRTSIHNALAEEETLAEDRFKFSNNPLFLAIHIFQQTYLGSAIHTLVKSGFLNKEPW